MREEFRQSFALLPSRSDPWIGIAKPSESRVKEFICGRRISACPLPVERPTKNELRRAILFSRHSPEPMVDQSRLAHARPSNNGHDIDLRVGPGGIQVSEVLFSTKYLTAGNG